MKPKPDENRDLIPGYIDLYHLSGYRAFHIRPGMVIDGSYRTNIEGDGVGAPDIFAVSERPPRRFITQEVKVPGVKRSPAQIDWGRILTGTPGVEYYVGYGDFEEFAAIIRAPVDAPISPLKRAFNILAKIESSNPGNQLLRDLRDWMEMIPDQERTVTDG